MTTSTSARTARTASPGLVLLLTSVSFFMVSLDALVVVTALPAIHASVGGSVATLEWAVNAYSLPFAAGIITAPPPGNPPRPPSPHLARPRAATALVAPVTAGP